MLLLTSLQVAVLVALSAARGADFTTGVRTLWFVTAAVVFCIAMYALAEILTVRLPSPVEFTRAVSGVAIVPFFFAGSLFPLTALPHWLAAVAKLLPQSCSGSGLCPRSGRERVGVRIVGECAKLGVAVSPTSVRNILRRHHLQPAPRRHGPSWVEFLPSQASGCWPVTSSPSTP